MKKIYAWHFLPANGRLRYDESVIVKPGKTLKVDEAKIKPCEFGLHASRRAIDALGYAPGPIICRVSLSGKIIEEQDKLVASERKVLWMADASVVLYEFACWSAERALYREREAGREPDPRSFAVIETRRRWIKHDATNAELSAAESAARSAAWSATWSAAWSAESAAWSAAWSAAESAARSAAWSATWSAAWSAAESAAWSAESATWSAESATWSAARDEQESQLVFMLKTLKPGYQK